jgi:hypothetical protein
MGLHGLLQGELYLYLLSVISKGRQRFCFMMENGIVLNERSGFWW